MKKVNLGSGPSGKKGWINYDWGLLPFLNKYGLIKLAVFFGFIDKSYLIKWPKIYLVDIRKKLPLADSSVDFVYCSHVLEHFKPNIIDKVLGESRRILKKNGILRVVIPDIEYILKNYKNAKQFNEYVFGYDKEKKYKFSMFIRGHEWMMDKEEIKNKLIKAGFRKIKFTRITKLDLPVYRGNSLFVEARN